ncbi:MAG: anaerobic carbon-monoxide dehydrogenase catalytic subunit [Armatimonadetes bacterium]|nr:anaerobic carbon-monoxide dehydrogenase catalytic subunit [Armatimonadota bacterium]
MAEARTASASDQRLLEIAGEMGITTVFDRAASMKECPIGSGASGVCCKMCAMGPCRLVTRRGQKVVGVCGASVETIAARNFARMVAGGTAAHSDHGREVSNVFLAAAKGEIAGYEIRDEAKLRMVAGVLGVPTDGRSTRDIAIAVGEMAVGEYGKQAGELLFIRRAPQRRQEIWRRLGVVPRGIDREVVETMHRTTMGVDQDYENITFQATRTALADGWGGSMLATELQDILFRTPVPVRGQVNLGVLEEKQVNIVIHGHEPLLSEMIVRAAREPEMVALAKSLGAEGINISGICCTANEVLVRHGVPVAGNFLQQELAITTGAVEAMVVDVQCVMQGLADVAQCFHTDLITTSPRAKIAGATHIQFNEHDAISTAREIVKRAVGNFPKRKGNVQIPKEKYDLVAGFSHETINYMLGGSFRASYTPLNDNIINGRIRGIAGVVGCNNPRVPHDVVHNELVKELIANNVLVVQTGCAAIACAKSGFTVPEAARKYAGAGLAEVCEAVGIPPVLHSGACVDNSRILIACTEMVKTGGLGNDISDLPVAGAAPEWMSEKAIAIGQYFVASGVFTVFGVHWPTAASQEYTDYLFKGHEGLYGGKWACEPDPAKMAAAIIDHIDGKRTALGINVKKERKLFDMADRRELATG